MYTESFLGDVDSILSAMAIANKSKPMQFSIRQRAQDKADRFGLSKQTKLTMAAYLRKAFFEHGVGSDFLTPVEIDLGDLGTIIVNTPAQANNLHAKLTGKTILGDKPKRQRKQ